MILKYQTDVQSLYLELIEDIFQISEKCNTKTFIWGGFVHDILAGHFIRNHHDLDGFTLDLWELIDEIGFLFEEKGYSITLLPDVKLLRVEKGKIHAVFNGLKFDGSSAFWFHGGDEGILSFPKHWLSNSPTRFYSTQAYISGVEFEYLVKSYPYLLDPNWKCRNHDLDFKKWLKNRIDIKEFNRILDKGMVWCDNPYWVQRGFTQYRNRQYPAANNKKFVSK
jgi:hypothetical protein